MAPDTAALDVDCPTCGKMRGRACETWWRLRPRRPHKARVGAAGDPRVANVGSDHGPHEHVFRCQDCGEIRA